MRLYLRDGSAQTILRAATLRYKLQIQLSISPSHSMPTPGQPVPSKVLSRQAPGRVSTGAIEDCYDLTPEKSRRKRDSNPRSSALEADALTTRPTRWSHRASHFSVHFKDRRDSCRLACNRAFFFFFFFFFFFDLVKTCALFQEQDKELRRKSLGYRSLSYS